MKIGTVCYATRSGLGHLAKAFYDNGVVSRIYVLPHPRYNSMAEQWYRSEDRFGKRTLADADQFLSGLSAIIVFENVFNHWRLIDTAKKRGIRIILVPMYEWTPNPVPVDPDLVICPSLLDVRYFSKRYPNVFLNIPVDTRQLPWKLRTHANVFVHNAGHGQVGLTKGTPEVIEAWHHLTTPAKLILRGQPDEPRVKELLEKVQEQLDNNKNPPNINAQLDNIPYDQLFLSGDVYINAEQYNGLSLPLQEAYASGMAVVSTKRFPMDTWLPNDNLVAPFRVSNHKLNQTQFERSHVDPKDLAKKVDELYGTDISRYSLAGKEWAETHSWENMKQQWIDTIGSVL